MTILTSESAAYVPHIPTWTAGERLRKAREDAGYTIDQLAELTSISKRQIIYYENDKKEPKNGEFLLWQMLTRVPAEWLRTGHFNGPDGGQSVTQDSDWYIDNVSYLQTAA